MMPIRGPLFYRQVFVFDGDRLEFSLSIWLHSGKKRPQEHKQLQPSFPLEPCVVTGFATRGAL